ncbi:DUF4221 family protein [Roseivirga sp.]|uniref:DUF4221 family protein n=1 Tax=Roseivirga sp. TaxID=1964215 RepID=UPI003B8B23D9
MDSNTAGPDFSQEGGFVYKDGRVYYLNVLSREIKVFDFKSGEIVSSIGLERAGPNSVGPEPSAFFLHTKDSIFIYSDFFGDRVSLINSKGAVLSRFDLSKPDANEGGVLGGVVPSGVGSFTLMGSSLFVSRSTYSLKILRRVMPMLKLNLVDKELEYKSAPLLYSGFLDRVPQYESFLNPDVTSDNARGLLLISYPLDHAIYASDDGFISFQKHNLKSKYLPDKPTLLPKPLTEFKGSNEYRETLQNYGFGITVGYYKSLLFNKYRNTYYRVAIIPHDAKEFRDYRNGTRDKLSSTLYVVMTINENFEVMSEKVFSSKELNLHGGLFMSPEGLWGLKHQGDNEDVLEFELLK